MVPLIIFQIFSLSNFLLFCDLMLNIKSESANKSHMKLFNKCFGILTTIFTSGKIVSETISNDINW